MYDFSLLRLSSPVDFSSYPHIYPACWPTRAENPGDWASVSGQIKASLKSQSNIFTFIAVHHFWLGHNQLWRLTANWPKKGDLKRIVLVVIMSSSIEIFLGQCHHHLEEQLPLRLWKPDHCIHGVCRCWGRWNWFLFWGLWRTSCCTCPPNYIWVRLTFTHQM